jgi:hypothetical protein
MLQPLGLDIERTLLRLNIRPTNLRDTNLTIRPWGWGVGGTWTKYIEHLLNSNTR